MGQTCLPRMGIVDKHLGVTPCSTTVLHVKTRLVITSKPFLFFRLPILRRVARVGIFVDPVEEPWLFGISAFRVILQTDGPEAIRVRRPQYRMAINSAGGGLLMLQTYDECTIFDTFGVFLGIAEFQFRGKTPESISVVFTVQTGGDVSNQKGFLLELR